MAPLHSLCFGFWRRGRKRRFYTEHKILGCSAVSVAVVVAAAAAATVFDRVLGNRLDDVRSTPITTTIIQQQKDQAPHSHCDTFKSHIYIHTPTLANLKDINY